MIVESQGRELNDLIESVGCWWNECTSIQSKVQELREGLCEGLPLAGSLPCINKQDEHLQVNHSQICLIVIEY